MAKPGAMAAIRRIQSHTALRGIAALLVVGYHLQFGVAYRLPWETATGFFERSYLFVDLFFILSGFIISYVSLADDPTRRTELWPFLSARFARLYPLHAFCLLYFVCFTFASKQVLTIAGHTAGPPLGTHSMVSLATQFLLLNAWYPPMPDWNIATWSISAEFVAYAAFPLLARFRLDHRRVVDTLLVLVPIVFLTVIVLTTGSLDIIQGWAPLRCISGFLLGMMLFYHRDAIDRLSLPTLSIIQILAALAIVVLIAMPAADPLVIPAFVLIVWTSWTDRGVLPWLLDRRPLVQLGDWSYSIYLTHIPLIYTLSFAWSRAARHLSLPPAIDRTGYLVATYACVIGGSILTFRYVELPSRRWLSRRLLRRHQSPILTAPGAP